MAVELPRSIVNQILRHAQQAPAEEVCGLVASRGGVPTHCYPVANVAADRGRRFWMEPHGQVAAMREMRERGEDLFAIYHSHPHSAAVPSATDVAEAAYPEALYLIVSLDTQGVLELQGYRLAHGDMRRVDLELADEPVGGGAPAA
jgi:proteasome lid subunit RPN8/RPN11